MTKFQVILQTLSIFIILKKESHVDFLLIRYIIYVLEGCESPHQEHQGRPRTSLLRRLGDHG